MDNNTERWWRGDELAVYYSQSDFPSLHDITIYFATCVADRSKYYYQLLIIELFLKEAFEVSDISLQGIEYFSGEPSASSFQW